MLGLEYCKLTVMFILGVGDLVDFGWDFPYPSVRMPVMAGNIVATSQPLAAQAGIEMLWRGGNAVDAAIATAVALTVVEPTSNGIGGDAFAIVWDTKRLHGLNASGKSPAAWSFEYFSKKYSSMPMLGWDTVTVPGVVSSWVELSNRFGKLPFADLFEPAVRYAYDGFIVSPFTARRWELAADIYKDFPEFARAFLPGGKPPKAGERFEFKEQAKTLEMIAETKGEAFYRGVLAEKIVEHAKATGGMITEEDLALHEVEWVEPICIDYHGFTLHELPPNGQGIAALIALGILDRWDVRDYGVDTGDSLHLQIEAMKLAFADTYRYISDPRTMEVDFRELLSSEYLDMRSKLIDSKRAGDSTYGTPKPGGTVYLTVADRSGMMVSFIQSNFMGFGSGIVIPGTGISMQNRGHGFSLEKGHPNQVDGGKKPFHTIIPAFVTKNGLPVMSFGVMGGPMQPQGHVQVMLRVFDFHQNPQAACDAPRWRVLEGRKVAVEPGFKPEVLDDLKMRGHEIVVTDDFLMFGGAQAIYRLSDGYLGASDPRKDGQAVGF